MTIANHPALELTSTTACLHARGGEIILLNGASGSGKSLWLHRLAELTKLPPGITVTLSDPDQSAPNVRMLFDRWPCIWLGQTAAEELLFGLNHQLEPHQLENTLSQWGLDSMALTTDIQTLNRLQSVRLSLAAMSLATPALALLDNPTASLSQPDALALIKDIHHWAKQSNTIVVVACNRWQDWHSSASQLWRISAPDALPSPGGQA